MVFDQINKYKSVIEKELSCELEWSRLDQKRASRIRRKVSGIGLSKPEQWDKLQDDMIEAMIHFEKTLRPYLQKLLPTNNKILT
jgi:hypothetical protein